jgi:hypothetical protein
MARHLRPGKNLLSQVQEARQYRPALFPGLAEATVTIPQPQIRYGAWVTGVRHSSSLIPLIPAALPMNEGIVEEP